MRPFIGARSSCEGSYPQRKLSTFLQQPSITTCSSVRVSPSPNPCSMWNGLLLRRSYIGDHKRHEVLNAMLLSHPKDCFIQSFPAFSIFPLHLLLRWLLRIGGRKCDICAPFMAEHSIGTSSLYLWQVVNLCINYHPPDKEDSEELQ